MDPLLLALIISFIIQIVFFIFAATFKTDKVTDLSYGLSFLIIAIFICIINQSVQLEKLIVLLLVVLWSVRIATYLLVRIIKIKKDSRFDGIRENFSKFAKFWFFQALTVWIVMLPAITILGSEVVKTNYVLLFLGSVFWLIGFIIETVADIQKFKFFNKHKNKWIDTGLWKFSRHPNYFGEIVMWWSIWLISIPYLYGYYWFVTIGPLYITALLIWGSGVRLLEKSADKKFGKDKNYQKYKKSTSVLIPWFKK